MKIKEFTILSRGCRDSVNKGPRIRLRPEAFLLVTRIGVTHRGLQYLKLMSDGLSFREIAERVGVAHKTVENTMQSNYRRIGVNSDTAAVAWYIRNIEFSR